MMSGLKFIHYVIDPISYAFEAVLTNEFHDLELACSSSSIVPFGASYTNQLYQTCALPGSIPGSLIVLGDDYLSKAYDFHHDRIWFNLGVLIVQALVFLVGSIIATDILEFTHEGNKQVFLRPSSYQKIQEEDIVAIAIEEELLTHTSVLSWSHISLWVDTELDTRKLLDNINGYVKGGSITALMGVSGAGKSTRRFVSPVTTLNKTDCEGFINSSIKRSGRKE
jgi:ATP-binding cassette subfamily G (WHITE) protein 2 (SNQ2)